MLSGSRIPGAAAYAFAGRAIRGRLRLQTRLIPLLLSLATATFGFASVTYAAAPSTECADCAQLIANAGPNLTAAIGERATLDGSTSRFPQGGRITYRWSLVSAPPESRATLSNQNEVRAFITPDVPGTYVAQLIVSAGAQVSSPALVTLSTVNTAPVARAGADRTVPVNAPVKVDGSKSTDVDGDPLSYQWTLVSRPAGSAAQFAGREAARPVAEFTPDLPGEYVARLRVSDGALFSEADLVIFSTRNSAPQANAGEDRAAAVGQRVDLDGSGSSDPDRDPLRYAWSLSVPQGSRARLTTTQEATTSFVVDKPGSYVGTLVVNDGVRESDADVVVVSTVNSAPAAAIASEEVAVVGEHVVLDGSTSTDPDGDALSFKWSLLHKPAGSAVDLSGTDQLQAVLVPDLPGLYVAQLIVHDGRLGSEPRTRQVTVRVPAAPSARPAPALDQARIAVSMGGRGMATVRGARGAAAPGTVVYLFNHRTGEVVPAVVAADGSFAADIHAGGASEISVSSALPPIAPAKPQQAIVRAGKQSSRTVMLDGSSSSSWPAAIVLDAADSATPRNPQMRTSEDGSALAMWRYPSSGANPQSVGKRAYASATGWAAPASVPWPNATSQFVLRQTDTNGSLLALWASGGTVKSASYTVATGWSAASTISTGPVLLDLNVAVNASGVAVAVWAVHITQTLSSIVYASIYTPGTGWSAATQIGSSTGNVTTIPSINVADNGNALVMWTRGSFPTNSNFLLKYSAAAGWSSVWSANANAVGFSANAQGHGVMAWALNNSVVALRYTPAGGTQITNLTNATASRGELATSMNSSGDAIVSWTESTASFVRGYSSRLNAASGSWQTPVTAFEVTSNSQQFRDVRGLKTGLHDNGKAFVLWSQRRDQVYNLWIALSPSSAAGWLSPMPIAETYTTENSDLTEAQMQFAGGEALVATWLQRKTSPSSISDLYGRVLPWSGSGAPEQPAAPRANAGPQRSGVEGATITLDGSQSQGAIATYSWTQLSGPPMTLSGAATATPTFVVNLPDDGALTTQTYSAYFRLTVSDALGNSSSDMVRVEMQSLPKPRPVQAVAGDATVTLGWASRSVASYNVYWSLTPGVTKSSNKIAGAGLPFVHTSLVNGVTYYYAVSAVYFTNAGGSAESGLSQEVSATPTADVADSWDAPLPVSNGSVVFETFDIATDPHGIATAVWTSSDTESVTRVYASRFDPAAGWSEPAIISGETFAFGKPIVRATAPGRAVVLWSAWGEETALIYAATLGEAGWSEAQLISEPDLDVSNPALVSDRFGNALAVWVGGNPSQVRAARYVEGDGWQSPVIVEPVPLQPSAPVVAMEPNGAAIAAWKQSNNTLSYARFDPATGWEWPHDEPISPWGVNAVAMNRSGDAVILYGAPGASGNSALRVPRLGAPSVIDPLPTSQYTSGIRLTMDEAGALTVAWVPNGDGIVTTSTWIAGQGWSAPASRQTLPSNSGTPELDADAHGNALAVWRQQDSIANIYGATFRAGSGWQPTRIIEFASVDWNPPQLSMSMFGDAFAIWTRPGGNLWASRYRGGAASRGPLAFAGAHQSVTTGDTVILHGGAMAHQSASITGFSWQQLTGPAVVLSNASAAQPTFVAPSITQAVSLEFQLTVTDSLGRTDTARTIVAVKNAASVTVTVEPQEVSPYQQATLTATLGGAPLPTGSVQFFDGSMLVGTADAADGIAQTWIYPDQTGDHVLTARYLGDDQYSPRTSAPATLVVTDAPSVSIGNPEDGLELVAPTSLTVQAFADARVGVLTRIELLDGSTLIGSKDYSPPQQPSSASLAAAINPLAIGTHVFTARAVDDRGSANVSAPVTVRVFGRPSVAVTSPAGAAFLLAPAFASLQASASSPNGAVTQVEFFVNGASLGTATAPPFDTPWSNAAAGTYSITAKVTDAAGQTATSAPVAVTVGTTPSATVTSHSNGATITGNVVPVLRGTVQAPPNASVFVNGVLATVAADGSFFVNNVPLQPGSNTITIQVRTQEGQTSSTTLTLNSDGTSPAFTFIASPDSGNAPLQTTLLVTPTTQVVFTRIDYRCSDTGNVISTSTASPITCTYTQPGSYTAHAAVILVDAGGVEQVIFSAVQAIEVKSWQSLSSMLRAIYFGMLAKLRAGNLDGAVTAITGNMRDRYREAFDNIDDLPAAVDQLGTIADGLLDRRYAQFLIIRPAQDGQGYDGYDVNFLRGADGIWRIESM